MGHGSHYSESHTGDDTGLHFVESVMDSFLVVTAIPRWEDAGTLVSSGDSEEDNASFFIQRGRALSNCMQGLPTRSTCKAVGQPRLQVSVGGPAL
jgi:hypothetical protein